MVNWKRLLKVAVLSWLVVEANFLEVMPVNGESMSPTFHTDDKILLTKAPWWKYLASRGCPIVACMPGPMLFLKRISGEEEEIVPVDIIDPLLTYKTTVIYTVPKNCIFIEGDNKEASIDSRVFGPIWRDQIYGVPLLKWSSLDWIPF